MRAAEIEVRVADAAEVVAVMAAARNLASACCVLRRNPCDCRLCQRYRATLILTALDEFYAAAGAVPGA